MSLKAAISFKNVRNRIISFCHVRELKRLEVVCTRTNNSNEIRDIVATIRRGLGGTKSPTELADIIAALTHLCYMTVNLKHQADIHRRILFIRANACEVVAQLLRLPQYRQHAALQEEACWAVHLLARGTEGKRRMVEEEMHKIICRVVDYPEYQTHSGVQVTAMGALINLSSHDVGAKLLLGEGVCDKVVSTLARPCFATHRKLQMYGLWCIYNLATCPDAKQPLKNAGAIQAAIQALNNPVVRDDPDTLEIALGAIRNLTIIDKKANKIFISSGVHKVVLSVCRENKFKDVEKVHAQAMWTIMNLASPVDILPEFCRVGVCQLVYDELMNEKFMNNSKIVDPIVGIIFNLLRCSKAQDEFLQLDILKPVKELVKRHSEHQVVKKWGTKVIDRLTELNDVNFSINSIG